MPTEIKVTRSEIDHWIMTHGSFYTEETDIPHPYLKGSKVFFAYNYTDEQVGLRILEERGLVGYKLVERG